VTQSLERLITIVSLFKWLCRSERFKRWKICSVSSLCLVENYFYSALSPAVVLERGCVDPASGRDCAESVNGRGCVGIVVSNVVLLDRVAVAVVLVASCILGCVDSVGGEGLLF
jgi:hypothetical protein